jgi:hypothetical protein
LKRLNDAKIELLRLRAALLPEEEPTEEEKKAIETGKKELAPRQKNQTRRHSQRAALKPLFEVEISASARKTAKKLPEHYRRRAPEPCLCYGNPNFRL